MRVAEEQEPMIWEDADEGMVSNNTIINNVSNWGLFKLLIKINELFNGFIVKYFYNQTLTTAQEIA